MGAADTVLTLPDTPATRRAHENIPDRGDNWFVSGFRPIADFDAGTLKVTGGTGLLVDSGTVYWVNADTYTGLSTPGGTTLVHYEIDTSGSTPTGDIVVGGSPSAPTLPLARVDADAETTTELNRTPDDVLGGLNVGSIHNVEYITEEADLPYTANGTHTLEDSTVYYISGFVTITDPIELGSLSPLVGSHGGTDGLIYTGGGTMLQGTDKEYFARDLLFSSPGGTMFDLTADNTTEMLVESCSYADPANMGNITSLGTIDGYRVATWKGCNFESFDDGLTFDGDMDKIFFSESPFRGVDASGVSLLTLAGTCDVDIVDFADNYVKGVQSDTEVWSLNTIPNEILQYRGVTHDTSVTKSNVITGSAATNGRQTVGVRVAQSFPLEDTVVAGDLELDSAVTIPSAGSTTQVVAGNTQGGSLSTTLAQNKKVSKPTDGKMQYDARDDRTTRVFVLLSLTASNTTVSAFIGKNDNDIERSQSLVETAGSGSFVTLPLTVNMDLTAGDTVSAYIRDEDGTADIEIEAMSMTLGPE